MNSRISQMELKWYTHAKGETRPEAALRNEGDFVLFGPDVPHSFCSEQESLVLTVRGPSVPPAGRIEG